MQRTTLMLPPSLKTRAQQRAREMGISLGELIRRAVESELRGAGAGRRSADPLFADAAVFTGDTPTDLAKAHDRYLYDAEDP